MEWSGGTAVGKRRVTSDYPPFAPQMRLREERGTRTYTFARDVTKHGPPVPHIPLGDSNLMCSSIACPEFPGPELAPEQIKDAQAAGQLLKEE
jgi:hypothetical protein